MVHSSWNFSFERYVGGLCDYVSTKLMGLAEAPAENRKVPANFSQPYSANASLGVGWCWAASALLQSEITAHCALSHLSS